MRTVNAPPRHPTLRVALAGLMAGLLATGNVALAAPARRSSTSESTGTARLAVVTLGLEGGLEGHAGELSHLAEQAVLRSGRFQLVPVAPALEGEPALARAQREADAEAAMAEGRRVYDELDTVAALAQFEKAANLFAQTDLSRTFQKWVEAQLLRAACLVANGELKVAEVELDRVLALEPRAQLSVNHFPPESLAYAEKVKKSVVSLATATMKVTSTPAGARIYLDGRFRGVAPLELSGLTQADHFVTAVMQGRALVQRRARSGAVAVELPPAAGAAPLEQTLADVRVDPGGPGRDRALRALGQGLDVDQVLAVLVRRGALGDRLALTGLRLEVADGHNAGWAELELPADDALPVNAEPFLAALLGSDAPRRGGPQTHFAKGAGGGTGWLPWALVGSGAALVAGGAAYGVLALGKSTEYRGLSQASPEAAATASTGRTFALIADVGVLAGLATAGAGAYLALTQKPARDRERQAPAAPPVPPAKRPSSTPTPISPAEQPAAESGGVTAPSPVPSEAERKRTRKELEEEKRREKAEKRKAAEEAARLEREEKKRAAEEAARVEKEEKKRLAEEKQRAAEEAAREREERKRASEDEARPSKPPAPPREESPPPPPESALPPPPEPKADPKQESARQDEARRQREEEERRKRDEEDRRRREEEERRKREEEERRKREDEERRKREDEKKREEEKKRSRTDEDDLRNY